MTSKSARARADRTSNCADRTSKRFEYLSREKRQLKKKLIQEISCQLEQVNPDPLLERVKADVSSGV